MAVTFKQRIARRALRGLLSPMLRWQPLAEPEPGFSIVLGVPWDLRHLLPVNLKFIARTDLRELARVHVVFDRTPRSGAERLMAEARTIFPELNLDFMFYSRVPGRVIERINVSTWYNSLNCATAFGQCRTRYAILHDFDLFPLVPNYFTDVVNALRGRSLRFCGLEHTPFDGLTEADALLGTWCLGVDVEWLRNHYKPVDVFHRVARVGGRLVQLDPFSYIQTQTVERGLVGTLDGNACCHVKNLCGTYLRYKEGRNPDFVWRLHYLWYLESLCGEEQRLEEVIQAMRDARSGELRLGSFTSDFSRTHITCADVLRHELTRMEEALHGICRLVVHQYVAEFSAFLNRFGDRAPVGEYRKRAS